MKRRRSGFESVNKQSPRGDLSAEIAYLAARLIAEDGITSFAAAKQKAARQMGITEHGSLPHNHQIDAALKSRLAIFHGATQPLECQALRQIAADTMRWLDRFSPWLVGAVLDGSANHFSPIELEIVADDAKQLEMFLLNEGVQFKTYSRPPSRTHRSDRLHHVLQHEILINEIPIVIAFYPDHAVRTAQRSRNGLKYARAQIAAVELLLDCEVICPQEMQLLPRQSK